MSEKDEAETAYFMNKYGTLFTALSIWYLFIGLLIVIVAWILMAQLNGWTGSLCFTFLGLIVVSVQFENRRVDLPCCAYYWISIWVLPKRVNLKGVVNLVNWADSKFPNSVVPEEHIPLFPRRPECIVEMSCTSC